MNPENHLERAGSDLHGAVAAMSAPAFRVPAHRRRAVLAFAAGIGAVVALIAIPLYLTRAADPLDSPVGAAPSSTTTSTTEERTTESSTTTIRESTGLFACGDQLPYAVSVPEDFDGPNSGPSPESSEPTEEGQLVVHWVGRGGSVEIRWPANQEYVEGAEWGSEPVWGGPDMDFALFFAVIPADDGLPAEIRGPEIRGLELLPTDLMTGPCDAIQVVTYGPGHDGVLGRRGVAYDANGDEELTIYPDLLRPRDTQLVVEMVQTDNVPEVVVCTGVDGTPAGENMTGFAPDDTTYRTAVEALEAILNTEIAVLWPKTGYFELHAADGTITYANPVEDHSMNPQPQNGAVVSITVEESDDGWTVTSWESQSDVC